MISSLIFVFVLLSDRVERVLPSEEGKGLWIGLRKRDFSSVSDITQRIEQLIPNDRDDCSIFLQCSPDRDCLKNSGDARLS